MNIAQLKKLSLWSIIGFLSLSATVAIVSLITGGFGEMQIKIILTTLAISGASICAMACAAFIEKRGFLALGLAGILCAVVAAGLAIGGMWAEADWRAYWKITVTFIIFSAAFAHTLLLFLPRLSASCQWSQAMLAISVLLLAVLGAVAWWAEISDLTYYRFLGIVAVLVVLLTLIVPICAKLAPSGASSEEDTSRLSLTREADGTYRDRAGERYQVTRIARDV